MRQYAVCENEVVYIKVLESSGGETPPQRNPWFLLVLEGECRAKVGGMSWAMHENDFLLVNSEQRLSYTVPGGCLMVKAEIKHAAAKDYLELADYSLSCSSLEKGAGTSEIRQSLRRLLNQAVNKDGGDPVLLLSDSYQLLYLLKRNCRVKKKVSDLVENVDDASRLRRLEEYLNENYYRTVTLSELAEETNFSPAYLSKYIKKKFGKNLTDILSELRLTHALEDVTDTDRTFTVIALDHGFSNAAVFSRLFRERYGMTPSSYRRLNRREQTEAEAEPELVGKVRQHFRDKGEASDQEGEYKLLAVSVRDAKSYKRFWNRMINAGAARDLLRADMQEHLLMMKEDLGFTYVRFWDIYAPEMMLYDASSGKYNFSKLDIILDFLYNHQLSPYLELGFKPTLLLRNLEDYLIREEREPIFSSEADYGRFLDQFFRHYIGRYGLDKVRTWYFEQWIDPRYGSFQTYLKYFGTLYSTAKSFSSAIKTGGAGFGNESKDSLSDYLAEWKQRYCQPDFISAYSYPYLVGDDKQGIDGDVISSDPDYVRNYVGMLTEAMHDNGFWHTELHLSEWNFTVTNRNGLNDSIFKGAYIVKNLIDMLGKVDLAGYWFGSDLFTEYYDTGHLIDGSGGLISKDGIRKPSFYAFLLFSRLEPYLLGQSDNAVITANGEDSYHILCHSYSPPDYSYYRNNGRVSVAEADSIYAPDSTTLRFQVSGVKDGRYHIKTRVVSHEYGSILDEWRRMDFSDALTLQDIAYLRQVSVPKIFVQTVTVTGGQLDFRVTVPANAIESIHIYYIF